MTILFSEHRRKFSGLIEAIAKKGGVQVLISEMVDSSGQKH